MFQVRRITEKGGLYAVQSSNELHRRASAIRDKSMRTKQTALYWINHDQKRKRLIVTVLYYPSS